MKRKKDTREFILDDLVGVKGWKAVGNKFTSLPITKIKELSGDETIFESNGGNKAAKSDLTDKKKSKIHEETMDSVEQKNVETNASVEPDSKPKSVEPEKKKKEQVQKVKTEIRDTTEQAPEMKGKKDKVTEKEPEKESQKMATEKEEDSGFHSGDTIEMKIDIDQIKKNKQDQLDLFDE